MRYRDLLRRLAKDEGFDYVYTLKHLTVSEVFNDPDLSGKDWDDEAKGGESID